MILSRATSRFVRPTGEEPVAIDTLGYFRRRNKLRMYDVVMREFKKSGISKATLARRLRKAPEVVNRLLSGPGNWTLDTVSDLMFAISGAEITYSAGAPLPNYSNRGGPAWLGKDEFSSFFVVATGDASVYALKNMERSRTGNTATSSSSSIVLTEPAHVN